MSTVIASTQASPRTLSEQEIAEIEHELTLYPDRRAVGLEALKIVQKHQGWVSNESLLAIASYLDISAAELEGVATFFNLIYRQPVGKKVILFCNSVSCYLCRGDSVREALSAKLGIGFGETTPDGNFTLLPVPCLGDCDKAPVMMVGDEMHRRLTVDGIGALLDAIAARLNQDD